jgi:hypothetical protein
VNYKQAVALAVKSIDYQIKDLNVQSNLHEVFEMDGGKNDWEKREKLRLAKEILVAQARMDL